MFRGARSGLIVLVLTLTLPATAAQLVPNEPLPQSVRVADDSLTFMALGVTVRVEPATDREILLRLAEVGAPTDTLSPDTHHVFKVTLTGPGRLRYRTASLVTSGGPTPALTPRSFRRQGRPFPWAVRLFDRKDLEGGTDRTTAWLIFRHTGWVADEPIILRDLRLEIDGEKRDIEFPFRVELN